MLLNKLKNRKGVSLILITGLLALLMVSASALNELIIRNLRSVQLIEASNRAYYAAEGGLEDALYELSPHFPGYQTPDLTDTDRVRSTEFIPNSKMWRNEWTIQSRSNSNEWSDKIYKNQKLMIYLFDDTNDDPDVSSSFTVPKNAINDGTDDTSKAPFLSTDINTLNVSDSFSITFKIPDGVISNDNLKIDNDEDYSLNGVNEDCSAFFGQAPEASDCAKNPEDNDCDGLVDEDCAFDTVIMWKLTDGKERSLIPKMGCLKSLNPTDNKYGSNICEDDFGPSGATEDWYSDTLSQEAKGIDQDGNEKTIKEFINDTFDLQNGNNSQLHFEFLIVAPMEHVQAPKKFEIPYIEYTIKSDPPIPYPYYTIKSDGYYSTFKQSITATITPKTTVPLFDFTIIQQQ